MTSIPLDHLGPFASPRGAQDLAQSVVDVARVVFHAKAASLTALHVATRELEFVAVAGEGAAVLPGTRFDATRGIAGWVLRARQPVTVADVRADPRFARDIAEDSGYVPEGLMAVPLLDDEDRPLGVLQVLDRPERPTFGLAETELLDLLAVQAVAALVLRRAVAGQ